jgi:hypothetical protein
MSSALPGGWGTTPAPDPSSSGTVPTQPTPQPLPPVEPEPVKPGWATTEFWVTVGVVTAHVLAFGAVVLHLSPGDAVNLSAAVSAMVAAVGVLAVNAFTVWKFIHSRQVVKVAAIDMAGKVQAASQDAFNKAYERHVWKGTISTEDRPKR